MPGGVWTQRARSAVRDGAIRAGALPYRPMGWTPQRWEASFASRATDAFARPEEAARYGVLIGYLAALGGEPSLLDLGCGAGVLRDRLGSQYVGRYLGVDPTAAAIEQASRLTDETTEFRVADPMVDDLGLFDVVVCNEVLYFADDPFALADRAGVLTRPGGHLLTSIWRHPGDVKLWQHLDGCYRLLDRVWIRSKHNRFAPRGWMVACYVRD